MPVSAYIEIGNEICCDVVCYQVEKLRASLIL